MGRHRWHGQGKADQQVAAPAFDLEPARPGDRATFNVSSAPLLRLQQLAGNAAVGSLVSGSLGHVSVQRRTKSRTTSEMIGASPGRVTFAPGPQGRENQTLAPGESGFTTQMMEMHGQASVAAAKNYADAHLTPVTAYTASLDADIAKRSAQQVASTNESTGKGELWGEPSPSIKREYEMRAEDAGKHAAQLAGLRSQQEEKAAAFDSWVPRANATFLSLGRLEGMQNLLGVDSPQQMAEALVSSLKTAEGIAARAKLHSTIDLPAANAQVTAGQEELTLASNKTHTAWLGYQETLVRERMKAIAKLGEKDEKKLKEIKETIDTWERIGKTVDLSLSVMKGYKELEGSGTSFTVNPFSGEVETVASSAGSKARALGSTVAGGVGVPTSASGLLKGIAGLAYESEILKIEKTLAELNSQISAHAQVADELGVTGKVRAFQDALAEYKLKSQDLQRRIVDRQMSYLKLGQEIDAASRTDALARQQGVAADPGKERFATVMLLTAQVREVLAMAKGAVSGFDDPTALEIWIGGYNAVRSRHVYGYGYVCHQTPDAELVPLAQMLLQTRQFHANVTELNGVLGEVDRQAGAMMRALGGQQEAFTPY